MHNFSLSPQAPDDQQICAVQTSAKIKPKLTKGNAAFVWDGNYYRAFDKLKQMITEPPILKFYEPEKELTIQRDARETELGAAFMQKGKPLAYVSRALTPTERNYAETEKEI